MLESYTVFGFYGSTCRKGPEMFESDASASIYKGGMIRNKIQADMNANAADRANRIGREWMEHAQALEAEVAKTKMLLESELMSNAGVKAERDAYRDTLKSISPSNILVSDTGKRFKDGRIKTGGRLIYEKAFDAKGTELRISNPKDRRTD